MLLYLNDGKSVVASETLDIEHKVQCQVLKWCNNKINQTVLWLITEIGVGK